MAGVNKMEKYVAASFGMILGLVGCYLVFSQIRNIKSLDSWEIVKGRIIERGTFQVEKANLGSPAFQYSPLVKYVFRVGESQYTSDAILPKHIQNPQRGNLEWATAEANSFPDEVTVFFDRENPENSFLRFPSIATFYVLGGVSVCIILYSVFVLIFGVDR